MFLTSRGALDKTTDTVTGRRHAGFLPPTKPTPSQATGAGANIPQATYGPHDTVAQLAQSKYGAPPGWWTPQGRKGEGFVWRTPKGTTVYGPAPAVFKHG